ncbi:MAG: sugar phosphate isomerase/epimerase [Planctomycetes bacterium]|nr:sugar phosphate isomerase/epimerase [Planctomycetota bacterium]
MLLGYNTNGLQNHRLGDALHLLADSGYRAVALTPDVGHLDPFTCSAREIDEVAALLDRLGLTPVIETGARFLLDSRHKHEPTLMTRDPQGRARRVAFLQRVAEIGAVLGARVVSFFSGIDRAPGADSGAVLRSGIEVACAAIRGAGLEPALEPEPGMAVATTADYLGLCTALGGSAPAITLDIGHLYANREGEPAQLVPSVAMQLRQVHLEDMRVGVHEHLLPGEGDVDFAAVFGALRAAGYRGPVCFELSRSSHCAPEALAVCARVFHAAGGADQ